METSKIFDIIEAKNIVELRREIEKKIKEKKKIIVLGRDIEFNRKVLEDKRVDMLLSPEARSKQDKLKERDSGLNHILCKIAKQNNITIGIDFSEILNKQGKTLALHLGRIMQNIKLYRKTKVEIKLINKEARDDYDLRSLLIVLGMRNDDAKKAVEKYV